MMDAKGRSSGTWGRALVDRGLLTGIRLAAAEDYRRAAGISLADALCELGFVERSLLRRLERECTRDRADPIPWVLLPEATGPPGRRGDRVAGTSRVPAQPPVREEARVPAWGLPVESGQGGRFGRIALERGWIDPAQLEGAILEKERLARRNLRFRLGEILVARGDIAPEQVREILAEQGLEVRICRACDLAFNVRAAQEGAPGRCPTCGNDLIAIPFLQGIDVDGISHDGGGRCTKKGDGDGHEATIGRNIGT